MECEVHLSDFGVSKKVSKKINTLQYLRFSSLNLLNSVKSERRFSAQTTLLKLMTKF